MSEEKAINKSIKGPVTVKSMVEDLKKLGVKRGMVLLVHSSLSSMGWVCGGPVAVIEALEEVLGEDGTLIMPTHSGDLSNPEEWQNPPVPQIWCQTIKDTMPAFEADLTPTRGMGIISETFRKQKGVLRSNHPQLSFASYGKHSEYITGNHGLSFSLGEGSPLARIYELGGYVLLLGVDHGKNTSMHLAEYRADYLSKEIIKSEAPVMEKGGRVWKLFEDINLDSDDFGIIGKAFESERISLIKRGSIGYGESLLCDQRGLVDYAVNWMNSNRR